MDERELPFYFTKWADALVAWRRHHSLPAADRKTYQYEAELVLAIGKPGANITADKALQHVFGYAVGLDMTRRDLQVEARDKGRPWDAAKNFAGSAPLAPIRAVATGGHITSGRVRLLLNGAVKQDGDLADMIWTCAEIIAHVSRFEALAAGDLIYTGTPAGVGPVIPGDTLEATIDGLAPLHVTIGPTHPGFS